MFQIQGPDSDIRVPWKRYLGKLVNSHEDKNELVGKQRF